MAPFVAGQFTGPRNIHRGPRRPRRRRRTTITELAEFFGCARKTVYQRIERYHDDVDLFDIQSVYHFVAGQMISQHVRSMMRKPKRKKAE